MRQFHWRLVCDNKKIGLIARSLVIKATVQEAESVHSHKVQRPDKYSSLRKHTSKKESTMMKVISLRTFLVLHISIILRTDVHIA